MLLSETVYSKIVPHVVTFSKICCLLDSQSHRIVGEGGGWSIFYGKWVIGLRNGKGGASFARQGLFFLLDSQVIQIFRLKNRLIIIRAVTYMFRGRMCF